MVIDQLPLLVDSVINEGLFNALKAINKAVIGGLFL